MKTYEYQILRYMPDHISGEFLNVGIILFCHEDKNLLYDFIDSRKRLTATFHGLETSHIMRKLKTIQQVLATYKKQEFGKLQFQNSSGVEFYSSLTLNKDDSALQFSEVRKGIDLSIEVTFSDLKSRLLNKWSSDSVSEYKSDEDVWKDCYKRYFENAGITKKMTPRTVVTQTDTLEFEQAYKNGVWNYFQPINLNLSKADSIKSKVYKWRGIIAEMQTANEDMKLFFCLKCLQLIINSLSLL